SPAISIDQKSRSNNPRSTVATITEIYDYLRVLYARIGRPHCLVCGEEIKRLSNEEILDFILQKVKKTGKASQEKKVMGVAYTSLPVQIFAPVVRGRKGEYYQLLYDLLGRGYAKVRVDGALKNLRDQIILSKTKKHTILVLVDEIDILEFKENAKISRERLAESLERALHEADGLVNVVIGQEESLMSAKFSCPHDGFSYPEIEPRLFSFNSPYGACEACNGLGTKHFFGTEPCPTCNGARLRQEALHVLIGGKNIVNATSMSISDAYEFFGTVSLSPREREISKVVIKEIENRLAFMLDVGIDYLTLDRRANTLSGGEAQRIRLASQLGSKLVGALYVLDEPTIGLHQRDNDRLIKTLQNLRDIGNTIIVVEHDEDTIFASDYIVDIGPAAGIHGGEIIVADFLDKLLTASKNTSGSITLDYLRGDKMVEIPAKRRTQDKGALRIIGGKIFNIKNMNAEVPLGRL
ncbi:MAG: ABC-ATPase UvrA, partial [Candidatus Yonathbacteria bacterium]|nr:ABC-ATPase UvrA [Candidatus Yonathbacteria bacterium]